MPPPLLFLTLGFFRNPLFEKPLETPYLKVRTPKLFNDCGGGFLVVFGPTIGYKLVLAEVGTILQRRPPGDTTLSERGHTESVP